MTYDCLVLQSRTEREYAFTGSCIEGCVASGKRVAALEFCEVSELAWQLQPGS